MFPAIWTMDSFPPECAVGGIQCEQVSLALSALIHRALHAHFYHMSRTSRLTGTGSCRRIICTMRPRYSGHYRDTRRNPSSSLDSTWCRSSIICTGGSHPEAHVLFLTPLSPPPPTTSPTLHLAASHLSPRTLSPFLLRLIADAIIRMILALISESE